MRRVGESIVAHDAVVAGDIVLSGSLVPLEPVTAGDEMTVHIGGLGEASVRFV